MAGTVAEVMTRNVVAVRRHAGYKDIVIAMRRRHVSAVPVLDDADRVIGVVSEADLLLKEGYPGGPDEARLLLRRKDRAKAAALTAADLMTAPAVTIGCQATVEEAAQVMHGRRLKRLPVVDARGRLTGIVSRVDLLGVYDRPDTAIWDEVVHRVMRDQLGLDPLAFEVTVVAGVVTVTGQAESEDAAIRLLGAVWGVPGVIDVRDRLSYPVN